MALASALDVKALALASEARIWIGPWSHELKGQNDKMYSKLLIVVITLIAAKLVISQIHLNECGCNISILDQISLLKRLTSRRMRQWSLLSWIIPIEYCHCQRCVISIHFSSRFSSHYSAYLNRQHQ